MNIFVTIRCNDNVTQMRGSVGVDVADVFFETDDTVGAVKYLVGLNDLIKAFRIEDPHPSLFEPFDQMGIFKFFENTREGLGGDVEDGGDLVVLEFIEYLDILQQHLGHFGLGGVDRLFVHQIITLLVRDLIISSAKDFSCSDSKI